MSSDPFSKPRLVDFYSVKLERREVLGGVIRLYEHELINGPLLECWNDRDLATPRRRDVIDIEPMYIRDGDKELLIAATPELVQLLGPYVNESLTRELRTVRGMYEMCGRELQRQHAKAADRAHDCHRLAGELGSARGAISSFLERPWWRRLWLALRGRIE